MALVLDLACEKAGKARAVCYLCKTSSTALPASLLPMFAYLCCRVAAYLQ